VNYIWRRPGALTALAIAATLALPLLAGCGGGEQKSDTSSGTYYTGEMKPKQPPNFNPQGGTPASAPAPRGGASAP
jgi:hypothetical protein